MKNNVVIQFSGAAKQYCDLVDNIESLSDHDFFIKSLFLLSLIYNLGLSLPEVPTINENLPKFDSGSNPIGKLAKKIGKYDSYFGVYDPLREKDVIESALSNDLAEIYKDLKEGLDIYHKAESFRNDVIWEWNFGMKYHTGKHIVNALKVLHWICF